MLHAFKKNKLCKTISIILTIAFVVLDISWAYPPETTVAEMPATNTLAAQSPFQKHGLGAYGQKFQESIFSDIKLFLAVNNIGDYLFAYQGNEAVKRRLEHLESTMTYEEQQALDSNPDAAFLTGIDLPDISVEDGVVEIPYEKGEKKYRVYMTLKANLSRSELARYEWVIGERFAVRAVPVGDEDKALLADEDGTEPEVSVSETVLEVTGYDRSAGEDLELSRRVSVWREKIITVKAIITRVAVIFVMLTCLFFNAPVRAETLPPQTTQQVEQRVEQLILQLRNNLIYRNAAKDLGEIGESVVEPLIESLGNRSRDIRMGAAIALAEVGEPSVKPLIEALKSDDSNVRYWACFALGELREKGEEALPALEEMASTDTDNDVRNQARKAIEVIGVVTSEDEEDDLVPVDQSGRRAKKPEKEKDIELDDADELVPVEPPKESLEIPGGKSNEEVDDLVSVESPDGWSPRKSASETEDKETKYSFEDRVDVFERLRRERPLDVPPIDDTDNFFTKREPTPLLSERESWDRYEADWAEKNKRNKVRAVTPEKTEEELYQEDPVGYLIKKSGSKNKEDRLSAIQDLGRRGIYVNSRDRDKILEHFDSLQNNEDEDISEAASDALFEINHPILASFYWHFFKYTPMVMMELLIAGTGVFLSLRKMFGFRIRMPGKRTAITTLAVLLVFPSIVFAGNRQGSHGLWAAPDLILAIVLIGAAVLIVRHVMQRRRSKPSQKDLTNGKLAGIYNKIKRLPEGMAVDKMAEIRDRNFEFREGAWEWKQGDGLSLLMGVPFFGAINRNVNEIAEQLKGLEPDPEKLYLLNDRLHSVLAELTDITGAPQATEDIDEERERKLAQARGIASTYGPMTIRFYYKDLIINDKGDIFVPGYVGDENLFALRDELDEEGVSFKYRGIVLMTLGRVFDENITDGKFNEYKDLINQLRKKTDENGKPALLGEVTAQNLRVWDQRGVTCKEQDGGLHADISLSMPQVFPKPPVSPQEATRFCRTFNRFNVIPSFSLEAFRNPADPKESSFVNGVENFRDIFEQSSEGTRYSFEHRGQEGADIERINNEALYNTETKTLHLKTLIDENGNRHEFNLASPDTAALIKDENSILYRVIKELKPEYVSAHLSASVEERVYAVAGKSFEVAVCPPGKTPADMVIDRRELLRRYEVNINNLQANLRKMQADPKNKLSSLNPTVLVESLDYHNINDSGAYEYITEPEFIMDVLRLTGARLLVDCDHLLLAAKNTHLNNPDYDYMEYVKRIVNERTISLIDEIHLAVPVYTAPGKELMDTHDEPFYTDTEAGRDVRKILKYIFELRVKHNITKSVIVNLETSILNSNEDIKALVDTLDEIKLPVKTPVRHGFTAQAAKRYGWMSALIASALIGAGLVMAAFSILPYLSILASGIFATTYITGTTLYMKVDDTGERTLRQTGIVVLVDYILLSVFISSILGSPLLDFSAIALLMSGFFFSVASLRYFFLGRATYDALIGAGLLPDKAMTTPIVQKLIDNSVEYHPAFYPVKNVKPFFTDAKAWYMPKERPKYSGDLYSTLDHQLTGMIALMPIIKPLTEWYWLKKTSARVKELVDKKAFEDSLDKAAASLDDSPLVKIPDAKRLIVIGDLHGEVRYFDMLRKTIKEALKDKDTHIVIVGDMSIGNMAYTMEGRLKQDTVNIIDLIAKVTELKARYPDNVHFMRGNSEADFEEKPGAQFSRDVIERAFGKETLEKIIGFYNKLPFFSLATVGDKTYYFSHGGHIAGNERDLEQFKFNEKTYQNNWYHKRALTVKNDIYAQQEIIAEMKNLADYIVLGHIHIIDTNKPWEIQELGLDRVCPLGPLYPAREHALARNFIVLNTFGKHGVYMDITADHEKRYIPLDRDSSPEPDAGVAVSPLPATPGLRNLMDMTTEERLDVAKVHSQGHREADYLRNHVRRVSQIVRLLAERIGLSQELKDILYIASEVHDGSYISGDALRSLIKSTGIDEPELKALRKRYGTLNALLEYLAQRKEQALTKDEERWISDNVFGHEQRIMTDLHALGIDVPEEVEILIRCHRDYGAFEELVKGYTGSIAVDDLRLIQTILFVADGFESGSNVEKLRFLKSLEDYCPVDEIFRILRSKLTDVLEPVDVLEQLVGEEDEDLFSILREARETTALLESEEAFIEEHRPAEDESEEQETFLKVAFFDWKGTLYTGSELVPGALEFLTYLKSKDVRICIISSFMNETILNVARKNGIDESIVSEDDIFGAVANKENRIQYVMRHDEISSDQAVMFGDGLGDMDAAKKAGIPAICRLTGEVSAFDINFYKLTTIPDFRRPRDVLRLVEDKLIGLNPLHRPLLRAAFFDWDGTVVDTTEETLEAFIRTYQGMMDGVDPVEARKLYIDRFDGIDDYETYWALVNIAREQGKELSLTADAYVHTLTSIKQKLTGDTPPVILGVLEYMRYLASKGVRVCIASGMKKDVLIRQVRALGLDEEFINDSFIFGTPSNDEEKETLPKEKVGFIIETLKRLKISPANAIMYGDANNDMESAVRAGVAGTGRASDADKAGVLIESGATAVLADYRDDKETHRLAEKSLRDRILIPDPLLRIAFFDWDGTVADTAEINLQTFVRIYQMQLEDITAQEAIELHRKRLDGVGFSEQYEILKQIARTKGQTLKLSMAEHLAEFTRIKEELSVGRIATIEGVIEFIKYLKFMGVTVSIASGKRRKGLIKEVRAYGITEDIISDDLIYGVPLSEEDRQNYPQSKGEFITQTLERFEMSRGNAVMFGDSNNDMRAALAAGIISIGRIEDELEEREVILSGASGVISNFADAIDIHRLIEKELRRQRPRQEPLFDRPLEWEPFEDSDFTVNHTCRACGSDNYERTGITFIANHRVYEILRCKEDGYMWASLEPSEEAARTKMYNNPAYFGQGRTKLPPDQMHDWRNYVGYGYVAYDNKRAKAMRVADNEGYIEENFDRGFLDRDRAARDKVLDVGSGTGYSLLAMQNKGYRVENLFGVEISADAVESAVKNGISRDNLVCGDILAVPESQNGTFNIVTAYDVLEHVYDIRAFMARIKALLTENGRILLSIPVCGEEGPDILRSLEHISYFSVPALKRFLEGFGFEDIQFHVEEDKKAKVRTPLMAIVLARLGEGEEDETPRVATRSIMDVEDEAELIDLIGHDLNKKHIQRIIRMFDILWPIGRTEEEMLTLRHYQHLMHRFIITHALGNSYGGPEMAELKKPVDDYQTVLAENNLTLPLSIRTLLSDHRDKRKTFDLIDETSFSPDMKKMLKTAYVYFCVADSIEMGADYLRAKFIPMLKGKPTREPGPPIKAFGFLTTVFADNGINIEEYLHPDVLNMIRGASSPVYESLEEIAHEAARPVGLPPKAAVQEPRQAGQSDRKGMTEAGILGAIIASGIAGLFGLGFITGNIYISTIGSLGLFLLKAAGILIGAWIGWAILWIMGNWIWQRIAPVQWYMFHMNALYNTHPLVQLVASGNLRIAPRRHAIKYLSLLIKTGDYDTRWMVVGVLGRLGYSEALEPLIEALNDEDHRINLQAVEALTELGDYRGVEAIKKRGFKVKAEELAKQIRQKEVRQSDAIMINTAGMAYGVRDKDWDVLDNENIMLTGRWLYCYVIRADAENCIVGIKKKIIHPDLLWKVKAAITKAPPSPLFKMILIGKKENRDVVARDLLKLEEIIPEDIYDFSDINEACAFFDKLAKGYGRKRLVRQEIKRPTRRKSGRRQGNSTLDMVAAMCVSAAALLGLLVLFGVLPTTESALGYGLYAGATVAGGIILAIIVASTLFMKDYWFNPVQWHRTMLRLIYSRDKVQRMIGSFFREWILEPESIAPLSDIVRDEMVSIEIRDFAIRMLAMIGVAGVEVDDNEEAIEALLSIAEDKTMPEAIRLLTLSRLEAFIGHDAVIDKVITILQDRDHTIKSAAAKWLVLSNNPRAIEPLSNSGFKVLSEELRKKVRKKLLFDRKLDWDPLDDDDFVETRQCRMCGSDDFERTGIFYIANDRVHEFLRCKRDGYMWFTPEPTEEAAISKLYNDPAYFGEGRQEVTNAADWRDIVGYGYASYSGKRVEKYGKTIDNLFNQNALDRARVEEDTVLDVGAGTGYFLEALRNKGYKGGNLFGVEVSEEAVKSAIENQRVKEENIYCGDITAVPENKKHTFDVVTAFDLFEHVYNPIQFIDDVKDLLKPGGRLIMNVPICPEEGPDVLKSLEHISYFSESALRQVLEECGAENLQIEITASRQTREGITLPGNAVVVTSFKTDAEEVDLSEDRPDQHKDKSTKRRGSGKLEMIAAIVVTAITGVLILNSMNLMPGLDNLLIYGLYLAGAVTGAALFVSFLYALCDVINFFFRPEVWYKDIVTALAKNGKKASKFGINRFLLKHQRALKGIQPLADMARNEEMSHAVRIQAIALLGATGQILSGNEPNAAAEELLDILKDKKIPNSIRVIAARVLGQIGGARILDALVDRLWDDSHEIRTTVADILVNAGHANAIGPLTQMGLYEKAAITARKAGVSIAPKISIERLIENICDGKGTIETLRKNAIRVLERPFQIGSVTSALEKVYTVTDNPVKRAKIRAFYHVLYDNFMEWKQKGLLQDTNIIVEAWFEASREAGKELLGWEIKYDRPIVIIGNEDMTELRRQYASGALKTKPDYNDIIETAIRNDYDLDIQRVIGDRVLTEKSVTENETGGYDIEETWIEIDEKTRLTTEELEAFVARLEKFADTPDNHPFHRFRAYMILYAIFLEEEELDRKTRTMKKVRHIIAALEPDNERSKSYFEKALGTEGVQAEAIKELLDDNLRVGLKKVLHERIVKAIEQSGMDMTVDQYVENMIAPEGIDDYVLKAAEEFADKKMTARSGVRGMLHSGIGNDHVNLSLQMGANLTNFTIKVKDEGTNGNYELPVATSIKIIDKPVVRLAALSGERIGTVEVSSLSDIYDYDKDRMVTLHKTCLVTSGIIPESFKDNPGISLEDILEKFTGETGKGIEIGIKVTGVLLGSGLGMSSAIAANTLAALAKFSGQAKTDNDELTVEEVMLHVARTLYVEQLNGTLGGWQDSCSMLAGIKLMYTQPGQFLPNYRRLNKGSEEEIERLVKIVRGGLKRAEVSGSAWQFTGLYALRFQPIVNARIRAREIVKKQTAIIQQGRIANLRELEEENNKMWAIVAPASYNEFFWRLKEKLITRLGKDAITFGACGASFGTGNKVIINPESVVPDGQVGAGQSVLDVFNDAYREVAAEVKQEMEADPKFSKYEFSEIPAFVYDYKIADKAFELETEGEKQEATEDPRREKEDERIKKIDRDANNRRTTLVDEAKELAGDLSELGVLDEEEDSWELDRNQTSAEIRQCIEEMLKNTERVDAEADTARIDDLTAKVKDNLKKLEADGIIAAVIALARRAKRQGQNIIIGFETDWIPGYDERSMQHGAIDSLINELEDIGDILRSLGLDNVSIIHSESGSLAHDLLKEADATSTDFSNIIALGSMDTILSSEFNELRSTETEQKAFLAAIDATEILDFYDKHKTASKKQLFIEIMTMLSLSLELALGKDQPDLPIIDNYDKKSRMVIFLPQVRPMDIRQIRKLYNASLKALQAA